MPCTYGARRFIKLYRAKEEHFPNTSFRDGYAREHPDADPHDEKSSKDFVRLITYGIDDAFGISKACENTVYSYWKDFMAGWRRQHPVLALQPHALSEI